MAFLNLLLAASNTLTPEDEESVRLMLTIITSVLGVLIVGLIGFAYSIRFIARNRTHPCPMCMEFIPKTETTCPRCGKSVVPAKVE